MTENRDLAPSTFLYYRLRSWISNRWGQQLCKHLGDAQFDTVDGLLLDEIKWQYHPWNSL